MLIAYDTKWRLKAALVLLAVAVTAMTAVAVWRIGWERRAVTGTRRAVCDAGRLGRQHEYVIQGYYPYWATDTPPSAVAFEELTHVSHAFVWPKADGSLHIPRSFDAGGVVARARAAGCAAIVCAGGGGEGSAHFAAVASNASARRAFVDALCAFIATHGYHGAELNWEFPRSAESATNLVVMAQMLRAALGTGMLVNVTVNGTHYSGQYIDVAALNGIVDYYLVMTYDYHGRWSAKSGHNAPLYAYAGTEGDVASGIAYWLGRGVPPAKLVLGLAFYGRTFDTDGIGRTFGKSGAKTYREIAALIGSSGYVRRWDAEARVPYLVAESGVMTISYDDTASLCLKVDYAKEQGLGGVMIWTVTGDVAGGRHRLLPQVAARMRGVRLLAGPVPSGNEL